MRILFVLAIMGHVFAAGPPLKREPAKEQTAALPMPKVDLPPSAFAAVDIAAAWIGTSAVPVAGSDGKVLFTYGDGLPVITCAVLHVCAVEFQEGERIIGEPQIGDGVRWLLSSGVSGTEPHVTELLIIKPKPEAPDTNVLVMTTRRRYYLRLVADKVKYIPRTAFSYPSDSSAEWAASIKARAAAATEAAQAVEPPLERKGPIDCGYTIRAKSKSAESFKPERVCAANGHVRITLPAGVADREIPTLLVQGADGKPKVTNWRPVEGGFEVDGLFTKAALVLGTGKKQQRVEIEKQKGA